MYRCLVSWLLLRKVHGEVGLPPSSRSQELPARLHTWRGPHLLGEQVVHGTWNRHHNRVLRSRGAGIYRVRPAE